MPFRVLDDIAFEIPSGSSKPAIGTASKGDVVELTEKDAAALLKRGAVVHHEAPDPVLSYRVIGPKE